MEIAPLQTIAHATLVILAFNVKSSNALENCSMIQQFVLQEEIVVNLTLVFVILLVILDHNVNSQVVLERMHQIQMFVPPMELVLASIIVLVHLDIQEIIVNSPFVMELYQVILQFVLVMEFVPLQTFVNVNQVLKEKNVK
jgi:hypothetical protein